MELNNNLSPLLSIIIPLFNKENAITNTIYSILSQNYDNYEIIIINDGSTDQSLQIVENINDPRIKIYSQENQGISSARNHGIRKAKGNWIIFLDADDRLFPHALKTLTENISSSRMIVGGNIMIKTSSSERTLLNINKDKVYFKESEIYKAWLLGTLYLRTGSFIMPSDIAKKELFNTQFNRYEDLDFIFRCINRLQVKMIPDIVMVYDVGYASASLESTYPERDYLTYLDFNTSCLYKKILLNIHLHEAIKRYPQIRAKLKHKYKNYLFTSRISYLFFRLLSFIKKRLT